MTSCQLCGSETSSTTKIKIEGTKLKVCGDCSDMGEEVQTSTQRTKRKKTSSSGTSFEAEEKVLDRNYGVTIKKAREAEGLAQKDLAEELNEKSSRISKIEKGELKPDENLAKKLEKRLDIELYTNPEVANHDQTDRADSRDATVGDVADINE